MEEGDDLTEGQTREDELTEEQTQDGQQRTLREGDGKTVESRDELTE